MTAEGINSVFYNYHVFRIGKRLSVLFKKSIVAQSIFLTILFIILFIVGAFIDRTLIMTGKDTGLLEHPTIWAFLLINMIAPIYLSKALENLFQFLKGNEVIDSKKELSGYMKLFDKHISRQTNHSKLFYVFFTLIGLICFTWNTFQNQDPLKFLGFDFWDSFSHTFGYWATRLYKLYLWVFFLPAIIHIHTSILLVLYRLLKDVEKDKFFILRPYNQDEHAGVGIIIKMAINPTFPLLILGSLSVLAAFFIHGKIDATPIIGLCILSLLFVLVYLVPAIQLRRIIRFEKKRQLTEITEKQNFLYFEIARDEKSRTEYESIEKLNSLVTIYNQVKSIPIWPYWKTILKFIGVINIPVLISIGKSLWPIIKTKWF
jgi:hypothetical protein